MCAVFGVLWLAVPLFAYPRSARLSELVQESTLIVVAHVNSISGSRPNRLAQASVTSRWKGPAVKSVVFVASAAWACDTSSALKGETVLLFLVQQEPSIYRIALDGRGRMPLRSVAGKIYATFWDQVILPDGTPSIAGPDPQRTFIRSIDLSLLRRLVSEAR